MKQFLAWALLSFSATISISIIFIIWISILIKQVIVCLFVCLFVYLFAYGRPNRKAKRAEIWRIDVKSSDDECGLGGVGLRTSS